VGVNAQGLKLDAYQPEFSHPIWAYLDSAVSDTRIANGRKADAAKRALLDSIAARHGVDRQFVLAIWGLESAYGYNYGNIPVIESLATLTYHGRRRAFAEEQLISTLKILQTGDVTPSRMVGSWASAMGHTQSYQPPMNPMPWITMATGGATSGPRAPRTRWPPPQTTYRTSAGAKASPGASRLACPQASTTPSRTSRSGATPQRGERSGDSLWQRNPTRLRRRLGDRPRRRARPDLRGVPQFPSDQTL
jgi:hypothetical protein